MLLRGVKRSWSGGRELGSDSESSADMSDEDEGKGAMLSGGARFGRDSGSSGGGEGVSNAVKTGQTVGKYFYFTGPCEPFGPLGCQSEKTVGVELAALPFGACVVAASKSTVGMFVQVSLHCHGAL